MGKKSNDKITLAENNHIELNDLQYKVLNVPYHDVPAIESTGGFFAMRQGKASNSLAEKLTSKITNPAQIDVLGNGVIESKDFVLFIKGYNELVKGISTTAAKLLDMLVIEATRTGQSDTLITIPLIEYMSIRRLKDEKEARSQIKRDLDALERVRFEYRDKRHGKASDWLNITLAGGTSGIKNKVIYFRFNEDFFRSLPDKQFMYVPKEAFTFNDQYNPHSYFFLRRIALHKRMNIGKPNENLIGVSTLLSASPHFPGFDEVNGSDRHFTRRIIDPFERDMDAISIINWEYSEGNPSKFEDFINGNIKIAWTNYPDIKIYEVKKSIK